MDAGWRCGGKKGRMIVENIEVTQLPNGVRVVSETVPYVLSVSIGLWVGVGARDEDKPVRGITHFIEHMLFKGTASRDARQIALEIESRGGSLNAFTDKEYTCYYARALAEHTGIAMDVLTDMLRHSLLAPEEIEREKNVVIEEIKQHKDTPDELVHDLFAQTLWDSHPLGRPVLGSERTVGGLSRASLLQYIATHYTPDRIIVSAAGNVTHAEIVGMAERFLSDLTGQRYLRSSRPPESSGQHKHQRKRTEQAHFCLGTNGFSQADDNRFALAILDRTLGGNMSSRLFQEIREKRGLAYTIGSYSISYREGGLFTVYGGTRPENLDQVIDLTRQEFENVKRNGLTEDELSEAKTQMRGRLVIGLENMSSRMLRMGESMLYFDRVIPLNEILQKINAVTNDDIKTIAQALFEESKLTVAVVGPMNRE
jgi:predicted Zn-dependent peptidase